MEKTTTRRTVLKAGACWAAPTIIATSTIPAYAASKVEYKPTWALGGAYTYNGRTNTLKLGSDIRRSLPFPNGLGIRFEAGMGKVVDATLTSMKVVYALPKGWVSGLRVTSGSYGTPVKVSGAKYGISDAQYDTFEATFAAPMKGKTQPSNTAERTAFTGTAFTMEVTGFGRAIADATIPAYMGYVGTFTTEDGFSAPFNTVTKTPMTR